MIAPASDDGGRRPTFDEEFDGRIGERDLAGLASVTDPARSRQRARAAYFSAADPMFPPDDHDSGSG